MSKAFLFLLVFCCLHSFGQKRKNPVLKGEDLVNTAMTKGIKIIEEAMDPMNLLHLDSTFAKKLVDIEFHSGFCSKHPEAPGIYVFHYPEHTMEIAGKFNDRYAAEKLFFYYCKLPKLIHSDTIYNIWSSELEELISVLKRYPVKGLRERLKRDYFEWQKLALKAPPKVYPQYKRDKPFNFYDDLMFRKSDLYPDCNLMAYILANTLKDLKEPGFNDILIENLKKKQTYPYLRVLFHSGPSPFETYKSYMNSVAATRQLPYHNIEELVKDSNKFESMMTAISGEWNASVFGNIIYCNNKAWVEVSLQNGYDGFLLEFNNHQLKIYKIWTIIE